MIATKYPTLQFEKALWEGGFHHIAGIDEAGRGAWAGPVCAAAVVLPPDLSLLRILEGVRDSKLMTPRARSAWAPRIQENALAWGVGYASSQEIDAIGIVPATKLAAARALAAFHAPNADLPDYLLTDYLVFPDSELPQSALIKGDQLSLSVAAASVLAKTARDATMSAQEAVYPGYGFARHKGYGTRFHQNAIHRLGLCEIHRKSYSLFGQDSK